MVVAAESERYDSVATRFLSLSESAVLGFYYPLMFGVDWPDVVGVVWS